MADLVNAEFEIWLARHGETEWSLSGKHTGRTDVALTPKGLQQALALADRLRNRPFARVLSSPLQRAQTTCTQAGFPEPELAPDLMEWDYGELEGRTTPEIRAEMPGWTIWDGPWPGGETLEQVTARADRLLHTLKDNVLLFSHGHFLRILAARWLGLEGRAGRLLALDTGSLSVLGYERETRVVKTWNHAQG